MNNLHNKIVLITGASSGIGEACAKTFAQHSAKLILCARRLEKIAALAKELKKLYHNDSLHLQLDVRDVEAVNELISNLPNDWQDIDVLINNAGLALSLDKLQNGNINDWDQMIDTNVKGLLYMTRAVLPNMIKRNQGHIINIGSISGHEVYSGGAVYCATKFAVDALTKSLKKDLLGTKVRISSVDPGAVETEFSEVRFRGDKARAKAVYQGFQPLTPDDVADAVYYCASRPAHINIRELTIMPVAQASVEQVLREK